MSLSAAELGRILLFELNGNCFFLKIDFRLILSSVLAHKFSRSAHENSSPALTRRKKLKFYELFKNIFHKECFKLMFLGVNKRSETTFIGLDLF